MDAQQATSFTQHWLNAVNRPDVDAIVAHYSEDVEFQSPLVVTLVEEASGTIRDRDNLRRYIETALAAFPERPAVEIAAVFLGVNSLVVHFSVKERHAAEMMELDHEGQIRRAMVHGQL